MQPDGLERRALVLSAPLAGSVRFPAGKKNLLLSISPKEKENIFGPSLPSSPALVLPNSSPLPFPFVSDPGAGFLSQKLHPYPLN